MWFSVPCFGLQGKLKVNKLVLKIIHLMVEGSGKVAWLESNHFVGSSPTRGDIFFFWNLILICLFFTHSNTLESYAIKEGQENLKTQKFIQEMREIAITIYLCTYILPKL